jgi:hypothetical protein
VCRSAIVAQYSSYKDLSFYQARFQIHRDSNRDDIFSVN